MCLWERSLRGLKQAWRNREDLFSLKILSPWDHIGFTGPE